MNPYRTPSVGGGGGDARAGIRARWWEAEDGRRHGAVLAVANAIRGQQAERRAERVKHARLYGNRDLLGFGAGQYWRTSARARDQRVTLNVVKSCVDSAASKIAKNKPRALFLTTDGDFSQQTRAKLLTQYIDGLFDASKAYATMQRVFVDSLVFDTGCAHVYVEENEIKVERVFIDEILVDEEEGRHGDPRQKMREKSVQRDQLLAMMEALYTAQGKKLPEDKRMAILMAASVKSEGGADASSASDAVRVVEAWHLRSSKKSKDGVHVLCIDKCDLWEESYSKDYFPFIYLRWSPDLVGFYGIGLAAELVGIQVEINRMLRTIQEAQHLACVPRVYIDAATQVTPPMTNEIGGEYRYTGRPPLIAAGQAVPGEFYQHLENLYKKAYEITGISMLSATSRKPAGLDAAVAIREVQDIETERFILQGQRYEEAFLELARMMIDLTKDVAANDGGVAVLAKDGKFIKRIPWRDVELDDDQYVMRCFPVSFLPSSPQGRLQSVKELTNEGFIPDRASAMSLLDFPDLQGFLSLQTAGLDRVKFHVDRMLEHGEPRRPDKYIPLETARQVVQLSLDRGEVDGRPEDRLDLLRAYLDALDLLEQPAPQGMAAAPGPGGPPPGPPGGMVPMGGDAPVAAPPMVPQMAAPAFAA